MGSEWLEERARTNKIISELSQANQVAKDTILALLDARDFLGYQLSNAYGSLSDECLAEIAKPYLKQLTATDEDLIRRVKLLTYLIPADRLSSDTVALVLHCELSVAERVLKTVAAHIVQDNI